ncbi:hypothetical protein TIFTF001_015436 [Ficus carica]|uniref:Uncharacterized protein n=1 Tax=Ficus carica TaxID=3494 RepID=A0AA88A7Z4_FICCA|nr:hypothetical protein TIFTF001_015436 [Ficus carica]
MVSLRCWRRVVTRDHTDATREDDTTNSLRGKLDGGRRNLDAKKIRDVPLTDAHRRRCCWGERNAFATEKANREGPSEIQLSSNL